MKWSCRGCQYRGRLEGTRGSCQAWRDVQKAEDKKAHQAESSLPRSIRLEAERDWNREDGKVEKGVAGHLAHEDGHKRMRVTGAEPPAVRVLDGNIPVGRDRVTGDPTQRDKGGAPRRRNGDHELAEEPGPGPTLEHAKVLKQQRQLNQCSRE
jgi:hypothetical protein